MTFIILAVIALLVVLVILSYNGLVRRRNQVDNAWSQVDVQLKRRLDLIPNLVESVKGYAAHEKTTLEAVINARNAAMAAGRSAAQRPPQPTNSQEIGLRVGDTVEHSVFGEGIIIDITGSGDKTEAVINFREKGRKHLLLAWAPLKKL